MRSLMTSLGAAPGRAAGPLVLGAAGRERTPPATPAGDERYRDETHIEKPPRSFRWLRSCPASLQERAIS